MTDYISDLHVMLESRMQLYNTSRYAMGTHFFTLNMTSLPRSKVNWLRCNY